MIPSEYNTVSLFLRAGLYFLTAVPLALLKFRKLRWNIIDVLLSGLVLAYLLSWQINRGGTSYTYLQEIFPYCMIYFATKTYASIFGRHFHRILFTVLCFWLICESTIGLSQVFGGRSSNHFLFGMTGNFSNPGPYGGFLATLMALSTVYIHKHYRPIYPFSFPTTPYRIILITLFLLASTASIMGILVLPASMSRAAWVAFTTALTIYLSIETDLFRFLFRKRHAVILFITIIIILGAGLTVMKLDSAIGRLHIWHIELRTIFDSPITGKGPGSALGSYGIAQEEFFRTTDVQIPKLVQVAGCPEYAFNEYLKIGMETGIPGLILSIILTGVSIIILIRNRSIFAYGMIAMSVFAFFSYPLSVVQTASITSIFLAVSSSSGLKRRSIKGGFIMSLLCTAALILGMCSLHDTYQKREEAFGQWRAVQQWGSEFYDETIKALAPLYGELAWNYRYLYDYGYTLHKDGKFSESNNILSEGAAMSSDPMFHNIMGKNYEALGLHEEAEKEYLTAHYMVPCRLYPLVLLYEMYLTAGKYHEASGVKEKILSMPVNPKNRAMVEMRERVISYDTSIAN